MKDVTSLENKMIDKGEFDLAMKNVGNELLLRIDDLTREYDIIVNQKEDILDLQEAGYIVKYFHDTVNNTYSYEPFKKEIGFK